MQAAKPQPGARPVIIAVDGRSGAGKTTLALELAALLREHRKVSVFHLEDIYPGWNGLGAGIERYVSTVLAPLDAGADAQWSSWDWANHYDGEQRTTAAADVVLVEGVGAAHATARPFLDAVIWMDAPAEVRMARALDRDGDSYAPFWDQWAQQEDELLAQDDPAGLADLLVEARADGAAPAVLRGLSFLPALEPLLAPERGGRAGAELRVVTVAGCPDGGDLFGTLYADSPRAVWLDSSNAGSEGLSGRNRFSIMADDGGPHGLLARHRGGSTQLRGAGVTARLRGPFFRWLESEWGQPAVTVPDGYECGFALGWLGYLGYELKRETGGADVESPHDDAALIFAGRAAVLDHERRCVHLLTLEGPDDAWLETARRRVLALSAAGHAPAGLSAAGLPGPVGHAPGGSQEADGRPGTAVSGAGPEFTGRDGEADYAAKIGRAMAAITEGDSYEVCLTTVLTGQLPDAAPDAPLWETYRRLRAASPAPFASYLRLDSLHIASSSPERFLRITADGGLRAEPIKGTRPRDTADPQRDSRMVEELRHSAKDRAENIMIVDLLRNDLSRFAAPESLTVPRLCAIESYATVHQMVSTIDAVLRPGASRAEAVAAAFPAGSMTGAPKISTMAILDELEGGPRGVYSGAIGYFSLDGAADLSVTIRAVVAVHGEDSTALSLGVGGAITADSAPREEWLEVRAKAAGVLAALGSDFPADRRPNLDPDPHPAPVPRPA
ncbi:MAG: chorismate-binding protein [Actinomycetales bacterium]